MRILAATLPRILVPLDGSTLAEEALGTAVALARQSGAEVHLVTVQPPVVPAGAEFGITEAVPFVTGVREDVECYLTLMTARLARAHGVRVAPAVLEGDPANRLAEYARTRSIPLAIMTTHGRGGFGRFCLGSVANRLLRQIEAPVLLLRHGVRCGEAGFERILVALDGSPTSEEALIRAIELGALAASPLYTLVRVVEPPSPLLTPIGAFPSFCDDPSLYWVMAAAANRLAVVAQWMRLCGLSVETQVLVGDAADQLVAFADRTQSQLIVVGTRAARGLDRLILGSVADTVVRNARQPVLVVPPGAARRSSYPYSAQPDAAGSGQPDSEVLTA